MKSGLDSMPQSVEVPRFSCRGFQRSTDCLDAESGKSFGQSRIQTVNSVTNIGDEKRSYVIMSSRWTLDHSKRFMKRYRWNVMVCVVLGFAVTGCSPGESGPPRYLVQGAVTFDGQPVPDGEVLFVSEKGPGAMIPIVDGEFRGQGKTGVPAGQFEVRVSGRTKGDGGAMSESRTLFPEYKTTVTVAASDNKIDIAVPSASGTK